MMETDQEVNELPVTYENISSQVLELLHYEIMFTLQQRRQGAVIIHFVICFYAFAALAILCDDYFCASLNKICQRLNIQPDVAGATFMAAGSSMPTMFISVTSVFLDEGDIGLGTIIGSTMFNILFITGICGVATTTAMNLKPYSIIRDASFYVIYLIVLIFAMYDGMVHWYEATVVTLVYGFYILIMCRNSTLEHHFNTWARAHISQTRSPTRQGSPEKTPTKSPTQFPKKSPTETPTKSPTEIPIKSPTETPTKSPTETPIKSPTQSPTKSPTETPTKSPTGSTVKSPLNSAAKYSSNSPLNTDLFADPPLSPRADRPSTLPSAVTAIKMINQTELDDQLNTSEDRRSVFSDTDSTIPHTKYDDEPDNALTCPPGRCKRVLWTIMLPIRMLYYITIPDCRLESWKDCYVVTFVMSIAWMGVHSYVLVWAVSVIGVTIGIPESIMGLTLLAAGSSVPDAIASLVMAEQGLGDMALANAIGSNIFDMLCLSVPWLLSTSVIHSNSVVMIHSGNILYVSLTLFGTVGTTLGILYCNKWRLDRRLGCAMLVAYVFFLTTAVVIESFPRGSKKIGHPLHRPDLPRKGLGAHKGKVKSKGFTWI